MRYIQNIDDVSRNKTQHVSPNGYETWSIAKPEEASGLLKWKIRIYKALYVLLGKADAFTYKNF